MVDIFDQEYGAGLQKNICRGALKLQKEGNESLMCSCQFFGISRQAVYQQLQRDELKRQTYSPVKEMVERIRRIMPRLDTRKLYSLIQSELKEHDIKMGRNSLFENLRTHQLLVKPLKNYTKTTFSHHRFKKHPNLLLGMKVTHPEQIFASEIPYINSDEDVHYLSLVTDAFTRKIMIYHLSQDRMVLSVAKALKHAVRNRVYKKSLIHHSDRVSQYCSDLYQKELKDAKIVPSTTLMDMIVVKTPWRSA